MKDPKNTKSEKDALIDGIAKSLICISLVVLGFAYVAGMNEHCEDKFSKDINPECFLQLHGI